jgi:hypothetical protein
MKMLLGLVLIAILAAAGASSLHLKIADGPIAAVFPQNKAQKVALSRCEQGNPGFDRRDPGARDACYNHASAAQPDLPPTTAPPPNQVDFREAAGRQSLVSFATPPPATPLPR